MGSKEHADPDHGQGINYGRGGIVLLQSEHLVTDALGGRINATESRFGRDSEGRLTVRVTETNLLGPHVAPGKEFSYKFLIGSEYVLTPEIEYSITIRQVAHVGRLKKYVMIESAPVKLVIQPRN